MKLVRLILSGYIFERRKIQKSLMNENVFTPTNEKYTDLKIAVYTVSIGGYDVIKEPLYIDNKIDYYAFTDSPISNDSIWKRIDVGMVNKNMSSFDQSRFVKTHPDLYFSDYDISVFIDGNIQIQKDIKPLVYTMIKENKVIAMHRHNARNCVYHEGRIIWAQGRAKFVDIFKQLRGYKKEGFPKDFGLFECNIIIRCHNNKKCISIMNTWWNEIISKTKRDQLSFTYSLWKNEVDSDFVMSLGNCSRNSTYFKITNHKK